MRHMVKKATINNILVLAAAAVMLLVQTASAFAAGSESQYVHYITDNFNEENGLQTIGWIKNGMWFCMICFSVIDGEEIY